MFAVLREGRPPAESLPGSCRLVRPGAAPEMGTAHSTVIRRKVRTGLCTNAGGTAEGLPFVPMRWTEGFFLQPDNFTGKCV